MPASSPHPLCSASARSSHSTHGCCSHPSTSKAGQAVCEPAEPCHRSPSCSLRDLAPCTAGGADKSTSCSPSTIQPQRTAAAPTTCGWVHGAMPAQEATPRLPWPQRRRLPRATVNHSGEERTDTHCDRSRPAHRVALDGSHFPFCCTNHLLLHAGSCSTRPASSKSFLHQYRQEPLTWFQPGLHPELIRSRSRCCWRVGMELQLHRITQEQKGPWARKWLGWV